MQRVNLVGGARQLPRRKPRYPRHNFHLQHRPWQIQPFMIAPVLPGETLKKITWQSRAVTDPIINPIMGWWMEHSFFYVKFRDLYDRDLITRMVLDPTTDMSSLNAATTRPYYHEAGSGVRINWLSLCLEVIVDSYFRYEGENSATATLNGLPTASVNIDNYLDSATNEDSLEGAGADMDDNLASAVPGQGDGTTAVYTSEIEKASREYAYAKHMNVTDMTFEDWCAAYGIAMPKTERDEPELLRRITDWQLPSNTIDPSNGTPRSAVSWAVQGRADKDRLFREPGFIVGVTVCRPKVLFSNLVSSAVMLMRDAFSWLPPQLSDDPMSSLVKVAAGDPPLTINTDAYFVDMKDLFVYGDQFVNFDMASLPTGVIRPNMVALPNAGLTNKRYPASTDADALFVTNTPGVSGIRQDGLVQLEIMGRQEDTSPSQLGTNITV